MKKKVIIVRPRGFCAGVARAVKILELTVKKSERKVYMRHQIVHNRKVVDGFIKKDVNFVEDVDQVPSGSTVVFSAHGSPPGLYDKAKNKGLKIIDATCPLVTKVHLEAKRFVEKGYFVIYVGHKGHPEPVGVLGEIPKNRFVLIETLDEAKGFEPSDKNRKLVVLTQTTLSFDDTQEIIELLKKRFSNLELPPAFDICYATQNRQQAVKKLAEKSDLILVVGSEESSNSNRLRDVARKCGVGSYLVDGVEDVDLEWLEGCNRVGITAGASAPEYLVEELAAFVKEKIDGETEELETFKEDVNFPNLPSELEDL